MVIACIVDYGEVDIDISLQQPLFQAVSGQCAGGSVQCLFVDNTNSVVLAATMDKGIRAYDLEGTRPVMKYVGHEEVVRGIDYLPEKGLYISGRHYIIKYHNGMSMPAHTSSPVQPGGAAYWCLLI